MRRDNLAFLVGGLFYGILIGFGAFYVIEHRPSASAATASAAVPAPAGPMAPTQTGNQAAAAGGAPMMEEIGALKKRLEKDPRDEQALIRLAHMYHDAGMWQQAVGYYQRAVDVHPGDADLLTDMGVCYQGLQQYDKALDLFAQAQQIDPNHWQSLFNTVVVAGFNLGQLDRAEEALQRLEKIQPAPPGLDRLRQTLEHVRSQTGTTGGAS